MKKVSIIVCACAATLLLSDCAKKISPSGSSNVKSKAPAEEVAEAKNKYTPNQLAGGEPIFVNNCGKCHELRQPQEFTVKEWDGILPGMVRKAKLSKADADLLNAWIITKAKG